MTSVVDLAKLSDAVYQDRTSVEQWLRVGLPFTQENSGFKSALYQHRQTAEFSLIIAGTSPTDLDDLHISPNLFKRTAVDENGNSIKGRGDKPNEHDTLTGTKNDGTAYFPWEEGDHTCSNWTSSADGEGHAQLGHHDRHGGGNTSWNSAHASRGCSQKNLNGTGGAGFLYCFAAD